jgi:hypothetical protein
MSRIRDEVFSQGMKQQGITLTTPLSLEPSRFVRICF